MACSGDQWQLHRLPLRGGLAVKDLLAAGRAAALCQLAEQRHRQLLRPAPVSASWPAPTHQHQHHQPEPVRTPTPSKQPATMTGPIINHCQYRHQPQTTDRPTTDQSPQTNHHRPTPLGRRQFSDVQMSSPRNNGNGPLPCTWKRELALFSGGTVARSPQLHNVSHNSTVLCLGSFRFLHCAVRN